MIEKCLIALTAILLPYDAFPLPLSGATKPLAIIPLILYFFIATFNGKRKLTIDRGATYLIIFLLITTSTTLINSGLINYLEIKGTDTLVASFKGIAQTIVFALSFLLLNNFLRKNPSNLDYAINCIYIGSWIPLLAGLIHITSALTNSETLSNFSHFLQTFFIEHTDEDSYSIRSRMLTLEPAWAAMQITTLFIPVAVYKYFSPQSNKSIQFYIPLLILNLLGTGSSYILLWLLFAIPFFYALKSIIKTNARIHKTVLLIAVVVISSFILMIISLDVDLFVYQISKFEAIASGGITSEGSSAIRSITPVLALDLFFSKYFLVGVGLNQFGFHLPYIAPGWYSMIGEGADFTNLISPYLATPRNLYARLLAETGIIGTFLFFTFVWHAIFKHHLNKKSLIKTKYFWTLFFSMLGILTAWLNYDSFANIYFSFLLAILSCISYHRTFPNDEIRD